MRDHLNLTGLLLLNIMPSLVGTGFSLPLTLSLLLHTRRGSYAPPSKPSITSLHHKVKLLRIARPPPHPISNQGRQGSTNGPPSIETASITGANLPFMLVPACDQPPGALIWESYNEASFIDSFYTLPLGLKIQHN